jgi:hypothetical protein
MLIFVLDYWDRNFSFVSRRIEKKTLSKLTDLYYVLFYILACAIRASAIWIDMLRPLATNNRTT